MAVPHKVRKIGGGFMIVASVVFEFFGNAAGGSDLAQRLPVPESWRSHIPFLGFAAGALLVVWAFYADKRTAEQALEDATGGAREKLKMLLHRAQQILMPEYVLGRSGGCSAWIADAEGWLTEVTEVLQKHFTKSDVVAFRNPHMPEHGRFLGVGRNTDDWKINGDRLKELWTTTWYRSEALESIINGRTTPMDEQAVVASSFAASPPSSPSQSQPSSRPQS